MLIKHQTKEALMKYLLGYISNINRCMAITKIDHDCS